MKTSIARGHFPILAETGVNREVKPRFAFELVGVVPVVVSRSASFRSVGESYVEGRVFGPVIDM